MMVRTCGKDRTGGNRRVWTKRSGQDSQDTAGTGQQEKTVGQHNQERKERTGQLEHASIDRAARIRHLRKNSRDRTAKTVYLEQDSKDRMSWNGYPGKAVLDCTAGRGQSGQVTLDITEKTVWLEKDWTAGIE